MDQASGAHPELAAGALMVAVAVDGRLAGHLIMADPLRTGAGEMLARLHAQGINRILLATGDTVAVAERITQGLGLDGLHSGLTPVWSGDQWGGFGMMLGPIFMILILVGIVVGAIYLLRLFGVAGSGGPAHDRAPMLLKERYAKGEIDTQEFEERKKLLAH